MAAINLKSLSFTSLGATKTAQLYGIKTLGLVEKSHSKKSANLPKPRFSISSRPKLRIFYPPRRDFLIASFFSASLNLRLGLDLCLLQSGHKFFFLKLEHENWRA